MPKAPHYTFSHDDLCKHSCGSTDHSRFYDKIIIGDIMPLVPGIVFTTSIRDFYNSDYLSGTIHLIDALLTALCIAVGVGLPIILFRYMGGGFPL